MYYCFRSIKFSPKIVLKSCHLLFQNSCDDSGATFERPDNCYTHQRLRNKNKCGKRLDYIMYSSGKSKFSNITAKKSFKQERAVEHFLILCGRSIRNDLYKIAKNSNSGSLD